MRKRVENPICIVSQSLGIPGNRRVSGKVLRMDTSELVNDQETDRRHVSWPHDCLHCKMHKYLRFLGT